MEATYNVIAGDGKEYGPISLAQVQQWIDEGRITQDMQIFRSDQTGWKSADEFAEFHWDGSTGTESPATPPPIPAEAIEAQKQAAELIRANPFNEPHANPVPALTVRVNRSARWFFYISGLSAANTVVSLLHLNFVFVLGLGITQGLDAMAQSHPEAQSYSLIVNVAAVGLFFLLGVLAKKGQSSAFVVGMILYALDAGLSIVAEDWIAVAFHLLALYYIFIGLVANQKRGVLEPAG